MIIKMLNKSNPKLRKYMDAQWAVIHREHYGSKYDDDYWTAKHITLVAKEGSKTIGALTGYTMAGVMCIEELIVERSKVNKGAGKQLLAEAEKIAQEQRVHTIYLYTGTDWLAVGFYKKLGYKAVATVPNFYEHHEFFLMRKDIPLETHM